MTEEYHTPVLLNESVNALNLSLAGVVVDATYGGGGHSAEILKRLGDEGVLMAFDQDADAVKNQSDDKRLIMVNANFRYLINFAKYHGIDGKVDAVFADLGVSSHQFDTSERGFSTRNEGELDMRMNQDVELTAKEVVNKYPEEELVRIFKKYADLRNAKRVASVLVSSRKKQRINTTAELVDLIKNLVPAKKSNQFLAQVFQAIRIEVNDEIEALKEFLDQSKKVLKQGGRLVVISYHSIEDRLVKNFMRFGNFEGKPEVIDDVYGRIREDFKVITKKPIQTTEEEVSKNPRARSAKMRIAEKL